MNKYKTLITNFILGGLVVSIVCVIADTYSYNLAGNLVDVIIITNNPHDIFMHK